ncbi:MAG: hypothetical protein LUG47_05280 [Clostridiales bacterium]|nr:hypothetical protein [Clostridiales bacterium]
MYDTLWQLIATGNYTLADITNKINVFWAESQLTDEQRTELLALAVENISTDQEKPELETTVEKLAARVTALEEAVTALQGDTGDSGSGGSSAYPEWTSWDGVSDNYQYGAIVSHNGTLWISVYNGQNVWEPGVTGTESLWQAYTADAESKE